MKITAQPGKIFIRIHDGMRMGKEIALGVDYSTGTARQDLPEYYKEVDDNTWQHPEYSTRIIAPLTLIDQYPALLYKLAVKDKLPIEEIGENAVIYCKGIDPEDEEVVAQLGETIRIEQRN